MARCLIVYFSQGGSTSKLADAIAGGLRESGHEVHLHNLHQSPTAPNPNDYDLLGIGSPVYYYRLPFNVSDYVRSLPALKGMPVFSFIVWATYHREAGDHLSKALRARGGREVGRFKAKGAGRFLGYIREGYRFSVEHPTESSLEQAHRFGKVVAERSVERYSASVSVEPPAPIIDRLERLFASRLLVRQFYSRLFSVDLKRCKGCGHCAKTCPTGNISVVNRSRPKWGRECLLCLMCEAECPNDAIASPLSWPVFRPFMMYNVYHACRDASLSHIHVVHSHGQTREVTR